MPFLMILASIALGRGDDDRPLTVSKEGGYTVAWPGTPSEEWRTEVTPAGDIKTHFAHVDRPGGQFSIQYRDMPGTSKAKIDVEASLDATASAFTVQTSYRVLGSKKIKLGTTPGREIDFLLQDDSSLKGKGRMRIYLDRSRLYQVGVFGTKALESDDADAFFRTFSLQPRVPDDPTKDWKTVENAKGAFSIRMPPDPRETNRPIASDDEPAEITILQSQGGEIAFLVSSVPTPARTAAEIKATLDGTRDLAVKNSGAKKVREKTITIARKSGRELKGEVEIKNVAGGGFWTCRIVVVGGRVYQIMAIGRKELASDPTIAAFFQSFQPTKSR